MKAPRQPHLGAAATRRAFLGTAALGRATYADETAPKVLKLGIIGMGGYGMVNGKASLGLGGAEVTAVCDVHSEHLARSAEEIEKPPKRDYRPPYQHPWQS